MSKGIPAELKVQHYLRDLGYLVGSRRHIKGPGDLLAIPERIGNGRVRDSILVEVKHTKDPFGANFSPADRKEMLEWAFRFNVIPLLAWVVCIKGRNEIAWIPDEDWPN